MDETSTGGTGTDGDTDCDCECPGEDTEGGCTQSERGCTVVPGGAPGGLSLMLALVVMGQFRRRAPRGAPSSTLRR